MRKWLPAISGIGLAVYPLVVLVGMRFVELAVLWLLLLVLLSLRVVSARWFQRCHRGLQGLIMVGLLTLMGLPAVVNFNVMVGLRFYPVMANLAMFSLFFASLFTYRPLVERLARLREGELPPEGVHYTRRVTQLWSLFLFLNAGVALATALWASDLVWAVYNGFIGYCLVGMLFSLEYLYRQHARRGWSQP